jgi:hypothetical protein
MAERLKARLLDRDKLADLVVGPDAYRDLPRILDAVRVRGGGGGTQWGGRHGPQREAGERAAALAATKAPPRPPMTGPPG